MGDGRSYVAAARVAYDAVACTYADLLRDELGSKPVDRAVLGLFADLLQPFDGRVADLGCGPGRVTAYLSGLAVDAFGVDLSGEMVKVAQRHYPHLTFAQGELARLPIGDTVLAGAVAWYSIIHTPPSLLPDVFAEFARVLVPSAPLLVAFQVGDAPIHLTHAYGHDVAIDAWRLNPAQVSNMMTNAGFAVNTRVVRAAANNEKTPQCYLLATNGEAK